MPSELWLGAAVRVEASAAFAIADPIERFRAVNEPHERRAESGKQLPRTLAPVDPGSLRGSAAAAKVGVLDLHYQSVKTSSFVLDMLLADALCRYEEVWIVTGTGHHTDRASHQRTAQGGVLHAAVAQYLSEGRYRHFLGKDQGGQSGAFLVVPRG